MKPENLRPFRLRDSKLKFFWGCNMVGFFSFFKPCRFIPHEHFSMFQDTLVDPQVSASLKSYFSPILPIIETSSQPLHWVSTFWGLKS